MRVRRVVPVLLVALATVVPEAASAATAATPNACLNSVDPAPLYRQQTGTITATSSLVASPPAYPSTTDALPGQQVDLSAGTFDFEIPEYLIKDGYAVGLLNPGPNTITVRGWVAIKATNTVEGVRIIGPVTTTATTTISVDPGNDAYLSSTPPAYTSPTLPATTWTATGGDVVFSQADAGALGSLPLNPGNGSRAVDGSMVVQMSFNSSGSTFFDCQPGEVVSEDFPGIGRTFRPGKGTAVDTESGTQNVTCLNEVGRFVTRELDPARIQMSADPFPASYTQGSPYKLTGTRAKITLSPQTVKALAEHTDGGTPLITADKEYPIGVWVTIAGRNTTQGTQTVKVDGTYTLHPLGGGVWEAEEITVNLPDTDWTPNGSGALRFSVGQPRSMPEQAFVGPASGGPGGAVVTSTYQASPYGSVVLRPATEKNPMTLDCSQAWFRIADAGIAYASGGRVAAPAGSLGRYDIKSAAVLPALTEQAPITPPVPPKQDPPKQDPPVVAVPGPGPAPVPPPLPPVVGDPAPPLPKATAGSVGSLSLSRSGTGKGQTKFLVRCPKASFGGCSGTIRIVTATKVRVGKRRVTVTVVTPRKYKLAAGRNGSVTLKLSKGALGLLRKSRSLRVKATLTPASGKTTTKTLTLKR